jgi:hypothetical protein
VNPDAPFINSLRAVFRMPPLYPDGRGRVREQTGDWMPGFREVNRTQSRGSEGSDLKPDAGEPAPRRSLVWNWKHEERARGRI